MGVLTGKTECVVYSAYADISAIGTQHDHGIVEGKVCCISLIKAEEFGGMVKGLLGPLMGDVLKNV